ncbi:MAG: SRPBCC family protein [Nevskiales bacterium]
MKIETQASVTVRATAERAFALATDLANFHRYFKGSGPIPAVQKVVWHPGAQPLPGGRRDVHNSDGSVLIEELLELTPPERHRYRLVSGFKPPFSWMVEYAEGDWRFTPDGADTRIDWHYAFQLRSPLALPVLLPIIKIFFRRAMQDCLEAMAAELKDAV